MTYTLSPSATVKALQRAANLVEHRLQGSFGPEELATIKQTLLDRANMLQTGLRRAVVFRWLGSTPAGETFEIGYEGEPLRTVKTTLRGVWAVWWLLNDSGVSESLRATDLAAPHADEPEQSVRKMIRTDAAKMFRRCGIPELESAAKACHITRGILTCDRPVHAPKVVTR